jgi:hypothetical protein
VRLGIPPKALKREISMLSKFELEQIIEAWPDEQGTSSNPEIYDAWLERERRYDARIIQNALGRDRILALTEKQKERLEERLARLLTQKDITLISDDEILGQYELVTEHFLPYGSEEIIDAYNKRQKLN